MSQAALPTSHLLLALLICIVWGGNFVAGAKGMEQFSPFLFMILRFSLVLTLLFPFLRMPPKGQRLRVVIVCLLIGAGHFSLMFWALQRSDDVSSVAIVQQTYIPMAVVLAIFLMGERVGWRTLGAVMLAFVGVLVVGLDPAVFSQLDVLAITLLSALVQALGSIYQRNIRGVGLLNFQALTAVISLPVLLTLSLLTETGQWQAIQSAQWGHWAAVAYSAILASIVGHGLFFFLVQRHPVSFVMPYLQLTPVMAVIFGIIAWGDRPGWRLLAGGSLVICGVLIITLRAKSKVRNAGTQDG